jgi:hypothetical protein
MTTTILGQVVTTAGMVHSANEWGEVDDVVWCPASAYVKEQPPELPVYFDHRRSDLGDWGKLGQVGYLERSAAWGLMAVATLSADVELDGGWYWSDSITCRRQGQSLRRSEAVLSELSLVRRTGNCQTRAVVAVPGDLARGTATQPRHMPSAWDDTWKRAAAAMSADRFRSVRHTEIHDTDPSPTIVPGLVKTRSAPAYAGPTVSWFGQPLGGELAEAVLDHFFVPPIPRN